MSFREGHMERFQVGDFVSELLWTDTVTYEVVATTPKTITIRHTKDTGRGRSMGPEGNPYPIVLSEVTSNPLGETKVLRLRKDGTFRTGEGMRSMWLAHRCEFDNDGIKSPVRKTDYSF